MIGKDSLCCCFRILQRCLKIYLWLVIPYAADRVFIPAIKTTYNHDPISRSWTGWYLAIQNAIMFWCRGPTHIKMWLRVLWLGRSISTQVWSPSNYVSSVVKSANDFNRGWGWIKGQASWCWPLWDHVLGSAGYRSCVIQGGTISMSCTVLCMLARWLTEDSVFSWSPVIVAKAWST
jgi:hypothetical protein